MKDFNRMRESYLQESSSIRLGELATNLARIKSRSVNVANQIVVASIIEDSLHLIDWTVADVNNETAAQLGELKTKLTEWQHNLSIKWKDSAFRNELIVLSTSWSYRVLLASGLLSESSVKAT